MNTNGKFCKLTNLAVFADWLKDIPMGSTDAVLPKSLPKNHTIKCLMFEENTRQPYNDTSCLFCASTLRLKGNEKLAEETSKNFSLFINRKDRLRPLQFRGVHCNDNPFVEDLLHLNNFCHYIDIVEVKKMNWLGKVFKNTRVQSDCWETFILFTTWATSMQCSNHFVPVILTFSSTECLVWNNIWHPIVIGFITFIQKTVTKYGKLFLTSWTFSELNTQTSRRYLRVQLCLILNLNVCQQKISKTLLQQNGLDNMLQSQYPLPQTLSRNQLCYSTLILITLLHSS